MYNTICIVDVLSYQWIEEEAEIVEKDFEEGQSTDSYALAMENGDCKKRTI